MGKRSHQSCQPSFHKLVRVEFQGAWMSSDGGLVCVRELDERLGLTGLIRKPLVDSRMGAAHRSP
jgi:hypothetical protein